MKTNITKHIYDLVAHARKEYKDTRNAHGKAVEYGEQVINSRYRSDSEEIQAMVANRMLKATNSHIYILLV